MHMSSCQCLPICDVLQGINGKTGGGLPEGSLQVLTAMMGQDILMNATQQQMVSTFYCLAFLAASFGIPTACMLSADSFCSCQSVS